MEDLSKHKNICDSFLNLISQGKADGYVYLGPCEEQMKPLDPYPTTPRFVSFHMFQKPDGGIMTMRLYEEHI
jgi:hypothetical protein